MLPWTLNSLTVCNLIESTILHYKISPSIVPKIICVIVYLHMYLYTYVYMYKKQNKWQ